MKNRIRQNRDLTEKVSVHLPSDYGWKVLGLLARDLDYLFTVEEKTKLYAIIRSRDFDAYLALAESWGPQSITSMDTVCATVQAKYQVASLIKKYRFPASEAKTKKAAIDKFLAAESDCARFNSASWIDLALTEDTRMRNVYTYARVFLGKLLGQELPSNKQLTEWSRHGPGANLDTKEGHISSYFKYAEWPYSCTESALGVARSAIQDDERWLGALEDSYRTFHNIEKHLLLDQQAFWAGVFHVVPGNRIAFVPKNALTKRSVAIEPAMNLYLQLGVDGFIRRRLKRWGVDIDDQQKNQELARLGSLHWEDPNCFITLDLAAASDSIAVKLCEILLPSAWFNHLMTLRSPFGELEGETISFEKISSMGNGYTFALETAIFTSVIYGVQREFQGRYDAKTCAVYGDDLIVTADLAEPLVAALNLFGFSVNHDKSFFQGPFRESCGADWFMGRPVRPVFLTTKPETVMELWTDLNRLRRTLSLRFGVEESLTEKTLIRWIPDVFTEFVGPVSDEDFDSFRHSSLPRGKRTEWLWKYSKLVIKPASVAGPNFLFRKLMHSLRGQIIDPYSSPKWRGGRLSGPGSRFTVTKPGLVTVSATISVADYWRSEYEELKPRSLTTPL